MWPGGPTPELSSKGPHSAPSVSTEARPDGVARSALAEGAGEVAEGIGVRRADHRNHAVNAKAREAIVGRGA